MNPEVEERISALMVGFDNNDFSFENAKNTAVYYDLDEREVRENVLDVVSAWKEVASREGLEKEINLLRPAFIY